MRVVLAEDDVLLREGLASVLEQSGSRGLSAAREIRAELPETGILVLSAYVEVEHAPALLATGLAGAQRIVGVVDARPLLVGQRPL